MGFLLFVLTETQLNNIFETVLSGLTQDVFLLVFICLMRLSLYLYFPHFCGILFWLYLLNIIEFGREEFTLKKNLTLLIDEFDPFIPAACIWADFCHLALCFLFTMVSHCFSLFSFPAL